MVVGGASVKPETSDAEQQAVSESQRRVNRRGGHKCPICGQVYADVAQHLRFTENVTNQTELALLSKLAHRHFATNLDCPVQFCNAKHINRLDKHLQKIHRLEKPMITLYMQKAKDRYVTKELALLRASNPTPRMVSHLDELDDVAVEEGSQASSEAHSEHATTSAPTPPTSCSEAPCAHSTPKRPLPSHSASESPNEPGTSGMHFHSFSKIATPDKLATPLLGEPSPGCRNCQVLFAELERVKQLLKGEIKRNLELNQPHSSRSRSNLVQCKRRKPFSPSKDPQYVKLVEEFRGHLEGVNPTRKARENAKQQATRVIHFLEFMAVLNADLLFLSNPDKVCAFVAHLQERQFKPTTQKLYLLDVVAFLKYILNTSPSVRLGTEGINALLVELTAHLRDIGRDIVEHQPTMRRSKSAKRRKMSKECKKANVPRKTYLLRKKETPVVSSSEDDGTDDWKPAKTSSEGDLEVEKEPVKGRKVVKQKRALGPIRRKRKRSVTSIEDDRKSIEKSREYSENYSDEEEKQERRMVPKEFENKMVASPVQPREVKVSIEDKRTLSPCLQLKTAIVRVNPVTLKTSEMQQVCISRGTASILEKLPSTVVCDGTSKVKRKILNQSSPFKVSSSTGHSKRHRVRSTSVQTVISGDVTFTDDMILTRDWPLQLVLPLQ
ncbi:uncharacterized protein DAT39_015631, partial [Clarias magur]